MVHIIWKGKGWIVFVVTFVNSLLAELATQAITRDENYYPDNPLPFSLSLLVSAAILFFINQNMEARNYDFDLPETENRKKNYSMKHSFFFIPFRFWPLILLVVSVGNMALHKK